MRPSRKTLVALPVLAAELTLALAACSPSEEAGGLIVEVQTDFVPGREFRTVRVGVASDGRPDRELASEARDAIGGAAEERAFRSGLRVAEASPLSPGPYRVTVILRDAFGDEVARRMALVEVGAETRGLRVVLTRACRGVSCPGSGPRELSECEGGRCVDPRCLADDRASCPVPMCESAADCSGTSACATSVCASGSCLAFGDSTVCAEDEWCDPTMGCREFEDPIADAGVDGGFDGGNDGGPPPWDPNADPTLVAWFRFDEAAGATEFADASPNALVARCQGMTRCPTSGVTGSAGVSFDGDNDAIRLDHAPVLTTATGFTVAGWIAVPRVPVDAGAIMAKPFGGSFRNSWLLGMLDTDSDGEGELAFVMDDATGQAIASAELAVGASTWVHVAGTWDGAAMRLFVDGTQRDDAVTLTDALFDSSDVYFGADATSATLVDFFEGALADARIYGRALTPAEMVTLVEATRP